MIREITTHTVNGLNENLLLEVLDEPGHGGAHHQYLISYPTIDETVAEVPIYFQQGPIMEAGINGISIEVLLAIAADRLECFQKGDYSCRENALALTKLQEAMMWLQKRTRDRVARGVEGTSQK